MRAWCSLLLQQVFSSSAPLVISCSLFPIIFLCLGGVLLPLKLSFCLKTYWLVYPFNLSYLWGYLLTCLSFQSFLPLRLPIDLSILQSFLPLRFTYWTILLFTFWRCKGTIVCAHNNEGLQVFLSFCIVFDINQVFVFAHRLFFLCCPHFHFHEVGEFFKLWDGELLGAFGHQWVLEEGVGRWFVAKELS